MNYDCVIVGGGGAGAVLAAFLAHSSVKTLVVERRPLQKGNSQMIALSYSSILSLHAVLKEGIPAGIIQTVHVSCQGAFGVNRISAQEVKLPCLGWVLPMSVLEVSCQTYARKAPNITWMQPAECRDYQLTADRWSLSVQEERIGAQLLIAADGAHSSVAQALGLSYTEHAYSHPLLLMDVKWSKPHQGVAYERFLKGSTLAVLPLGCDRSVCVWTLSPTQAALFLENSELLKHALRMALGHRLGRVDSIEQIRSFSMTQKMAQSTVGARLVLLGNAAHTLHPIGAQGFNLTLRDALVLAQQLIDEKSRGDVGAFAALAEYQQKRACDQQKMHWVTQGLAAGVSEKNWSVFNRMLGLQVSRLPLIRSGVMWLGLGGSHATHL